MAEDERFKNDIDRFRNTPAIDAVVGVWVAERTSEECLALLDRARIPCGIVKMRRLSREGII